MTRTRSKKEPYLGRQLALNVLDLPAQHEGLQDLVQAVDDHHALLCRQPLIRAAACSSFAQRIPEPLRKGCLVIKHLRRIVW